MARYSLADSFCVKSILLTLNTIFLLFGAFFLGGSIYAYVKSDPGFSAVPADVIIAGMAVGSFMLLTSFVGFGAMGNRGCLICYVLLMLVLISAQIALGVLSYQKTLNPENTLDQVWTNLPQESRLAIQNAGKCCGFANSNDRQVVSSTCPAVGVPTTPGCYPQMEEWLQENSKIAYITLLCVLGVEAFTVLLAIFVLCGCCGIYKHEDERLYQANALNRSQQQPVYV